MSGEIKITYELKPCYVTCNGIKKKALFHRWTEAGSGIVELENGECTTYDPCNIKFNSNKFEDYFFED